MLDRNKTFLTASVTRLAVEWLDGNGFKPVETEVAVAERWIGDVVGVSTPTTTELVGLQLLRRAPRGPDFAQREKAGYDARVSAWQAKQAVWDAERAAMPRVLTIVIEVKTSVGDFRGDTKWNRPWPTNLCYVAMPEGLVAQELWPRGWGVILCSQDGTEIRRVIPGELRPVAAEQNMDVVLAVAVSRDNATRYGRIRELQQKTRAELAPQETIARISSAVRFVLLCAKGVPVEVAAFRAKIPNISAKLTPDLLAELERMRAQVGGGDNRAEAAGLIVSG
ncbi:MmcB family DNA repair protein [Oleiharenicola sp. Vm1]|uniref:MmcB family DNA repair protein n=1 Tax=Oleiharenicola sp. Vm1 TaxID=3398393 RepID=UPI0039F62A2B